MNAVAQLIQKSRAPKVQPHDRQHYNVHYLGLPATDYSDWDLAKEKFARKGRYERRKAQIKAQIIVDGNNQGAMMHQ